MSETPRKIGKYEILGEVGQGAMATVYRARDPVLDRVVALKMMFTSTLREADSRERFLREARSVARLQHTNIITVFEFGEYDGMPFIAMEYIEGLNLAAAVARGNVHGIRAKLEIIEQVCRGLAYAHRRGVVHRDVKPSNIILQDDGTAKLLDFGIARLEGSTFATGTGQLLGTPNYMAPEQFERPTVDHRVDVWAVGVVLYELITGRRPFDASTVASLIFSIVNSPLPKIDPVQLGIPPAVVTIVEGALVKNPDARVADLEVLGREVRAVLDGEKVSPALERTAVGSMPGAAAVPATSPPSGVVPRTLQPVAPAEEPAATERLRSDAFRELLVFGEAAGLQVIAVAPGERILAVGGIDGSVRIWDLATQMKLRTLRSRLHLRTGHSARTTALGFSADGGMLASGHLDGSIYVWNPATGLETETSLRHEGAVGGVGFAAGGEILVSGGADATVKFWELAAVTAGEARRQMRRQPAEVACLAVVAGGEIVITGHTNRCLRVHEVASGRLVATLHGHRSAPSALAVSDDGKLVASGCRDGTVHLHHLESREQARVFEGHTKTVSSIRFFASGRQFASVAMDSSLLIWDAEADDPLAILEGPASDAHASLEILHGARQVLCGLADGRLRVWGYG